jgi:hypothetical protein
LDTTSCQILFGRNDLDEKEGNWRFWMICLLAVGFSEVLGYDDYVDYVDDVVVVYVHIRIVAWIAYF